MLIRLPMLSALTVAALVYVRPDPLVSLERGEDVALVAAWALALLVALWLFVASACCALALRRGRFDAARRCAALVPAALRRGLEFAVVPAVVVASALPAHAVTDEPIVRTPQVASTPTSAPAPATERSTPPSTRPRPPAPTTTTPATTTPSTTDAPPTTTTVPAHPESEPDVDLPRRTPPQPASERPAVATGNSYVVRPGDNLWLIAQRTLEQAERSATELVAYWHAVIETNANTLRSGDPNLIYPGEVITLPVFAADS